MATPQAQQPPAPSSATTISQQKTVYPDWMIYSCMAGVILGPIAIFAPPRRFGPQSVFLAGATSLSSSVLMEHYTGQSLYQRFVGRFNSIMSTDLPEKAQETQRLLRQQKERREAAMSEEERRELYAKKRAAMGPLGRLWTSDEGEDWRDQRLRKESEAIAEGKGYGHLIVEHVKEAFGYKNDDAESDETKNDDQKKA